MPKPGRPKRFGLDTKVYSKRVPEKLYDDLKKNVDKFIEDFVDKSLNNSVDKTNSVDETKPIYVDKKSIVDKKPKVTVDENTGHKFDDLFPEYNKIKPKENPITRQKIPKGGFDFFKVPEDD